MMPLIKPGCPFQKRKSKTRTTDIRISAKPTKSPCLQFFLIVEKKSEIKNTGSPLLYPLIIYAAPTLERPKVKIERAAMPKQTYDAVEKNEAFLKVDKKG